MIGRSLSSFICQLQYRLQEAIIYQVSDDFMDITSTIKTLREAALQPSSTKNKTDDPTFQRRLANISVCCFFGISRRTESSRKFPKCHSRIHQSFLDFDSNSTFSSEWNFMSIEIDDWNDQSHSISSSSLMFLMISSEKTNDRFRSMIWPLKWSMLLALSLVTRGNRPSLKNTSIYFDNNG